MSLALYLPRVRSNEVLGSIFVRGDDDSLKRSGLLGRDPFVNAIVAVNDEASSLILQDDDRSTLALRIWACVKADERNNLLQQKPLGPNGAICLVEGLSLGEAKTLLGDALESCLSTWIMVRVAFKCSMDSAPKLGAVAHAA
jgi:hypothetical protein